MSRFPEFNGTLFSIAYPYLSRKQWQILSGYQGWEILLTVSLTLMDTLLRLSRAENRLPPCDSSELRMYCEGFSRTERRASTGNLALSYFGWGFLFKRVSSELNNTSTTLPNRCLFVFLSNIRPEFTIPQKPIFDSNYVLGDTLSREEAASGRFGRKAWGRYSRLHWVSKESS